MARTKFWSRYIYTPTWNAANHATFDLVGTLQPGETLLRSIISQDTWLQSSTNAFYDAGAKAAWGLIPGDQSNQPPYLPLDSFGQDAIPWLYTDQIIFNQQNFSDIAGSISYIARNWEHGRYTDTSRQYRVPGTTPKYLWLCQQFDPVYASQGVVISSAAASFLIMGPP